MQYAESLHEIVIKRIHYDSRISYDSQKCVHRVHVTQTTGYHTILTILIQVFHIFSQIHILFSKPLFSTKLNPLAGSELCLVNN